MGQITDPNVIRNLRVVQPQVQAQPFPTAAGPMPTSTRGAQQMQQTDQSMGLNREQDRRAERSLELQEASNAREQDKADRTAKQAEITNGVTPTESESTAAFLTTQLKGHNRKIGEIFNANPEAVKPGWAETVASVLGETPRALVSGWVNSPKTAENRTILNNRFGLATDVLLTLGTGAAYTKEQKDTYKTAYSPQVTDGAGVLADKKRMMGEAIIAAQVKSGVGKVQIEQAMKELDNLYDPIIAAAEGGGKPQELTKPGLELSTEGKRMIPIPEEMQKEYLAGLPQPGKLTVEGYNHLRRVLDSKYGFGPGQYTDDNAKAVVEQYNKTGRMVRIPGPQADMSLGEEMLSTAASSPIGTGAINLANAATFGLPEYLAGPEARNIMKVQNTESPNAAMIGEILGSVAPTIAMEKTIAKLGSKAFPNMLKEGSRARFGSDIAANALYGGERSAASAEEGHRGEAALRGAGWGVAGTVGGRAATRGVKVLQGEGTKKAIEGLDGVDLTTMQKLGLGKGEESFQGVPVIKGARAKSLESFNRNNSQRVLDRVGVKLPKDIPAGVEANEFVNQALGAKYNTIKPKIVGEMDESYTKAVDGLIAKHVDTPQKRALFKELQAIEKKFLPDGLSYNGDSFKDYNKLMREKVADLLQEKGPANMSPSDIREMGRLAEKMRQQAKALIKRKQPALGEELETLDKAWAHQMRIENATNRAATEGEGLYSPKQYLTSVKQLDGVKGHTAFSRGRAFEQQYGRDASEVLGSGGVPEKVSLPALGTAAFLGGGASYLGAPAAATLGGAVSAAYTPGLKKLTQALLTGKRPEVLSNPLIDAGLANFIRSYKTRDLRKD